MPDPDGRTGRVPVLLVLVLLLVIGSFVLLVTALITKVTSWAWGSVTASAVAGVILATDWFTRRKGVATQRDSGIADPRDTTDAIRGDTPGKPAVERTEGPFGRSSPTEFPPPEEPAPDPAEEQPGAAVVTDLEDEVLVLDERPRYHLAGCEWVGVRAGIPLPVRQAREFGFTPCAACRPDATIAGRHRLAER